MINKKFSVAEKSDGSWILNLSPPDGLPQGSSTQGTQLHIVKLIWSPRVGLIDLITPVCMPV